MEYEERNIRFLIGATYDVLPTPQNLKLGKWRPAMVVMFRYCNSKAYFVSLSQGRDMWRHKQVLRSLAAGTEDK